MHLDDGGIQALLHGELLPADARRWTDHAAECAACGSRLADARAEEAEVFASLETLDAPLGELDLAEIRARAATRSRRPSRATGWRIAASIVALLAAAGALYAFPGSPLRRALDRRAESAAAPSAGEAMEESGVAFPPGERFTVAFDAPMAGDSVRIAVVEDSSVAVRVVGSAAFAFRSGRLAVTASAPGFYHVDVPRSAPLVRVEVAGRTEVEIREGRLATGAGRARDGVLVLPLSP